MTYEYACDPETGIDASYSAILLLYIIIPCRVDTWDDPSVRFPVVADEYNSTHALLSKNAHVHCGSRVGWTAGGEGEDSGHINQASPKSIYAHVRTHSAKPKQKKRTEKGVSYLHRLV